MVIVTVPVNTAVVLTSTQSTGPEIPTEKPPGVAAEHAGQLHAVAVFGDDMGDLPAFVAVGELTTPDGSPLNAVRVAAVDSESPREVVNHADLTVRGAVGAVELLRALADAAASAGTSPAAP